VLPELARRDILPDVLTDQTSAHDALNGYVPNGMNLEEAARLRRDDPNEYIRRSMHAMATHVRAMLELKRKGAVTFDTVTTSVRRRSRRGWETHSRSLALCLSTSGRSFVRAAVPSGGLRFQKSGDIRKTDSLALELFPDDQSAFSLA